MTALAVTELVGGRGDPLLANGIDWVDALIVAVKTAVTFGALLVSVLFMVWFERKVISDMQNRIGPNRAGPFGIFQAVADGIKSFFKEDLTPERADRRVFRLAPYLSAVPAFVAFSIVPIGGEIEIAGRRTYLQLADPPIGILLLLMTSSIAVYGVMLAGWASGSKFPLLGSVRASAQMISYEAPLGLSVAAVVLLTGSLSTHDIVADQAARGLLGVIPAWNVIRTGLVPFVIFLIAVTAELNRPPFDLVEAEQELVGGYMTEYASARFALFYLAEFMGTVTMSAIVVTLFLGGYAGPILVSFPGATIVWPVFWFLLKLLVFLFVYVWFRATLPRFRYDQVMDLGWKRLIPIALAWLLVLAGFQVGRWEGAAVVVGAFVLGALFLRALRIGQAEPLHTREGFNRQGEVRA